ncbi:unnamed protein product [Vitrella brassicaformis CCMP3155]|uniref:Lariat debranching enzyme C-terminal domain-containing protein n=1 Tax=Vitrella brassicaformis (strain CCMP3155) TaxID=1169540 RepID=A0A0G4FK79_VITBC|nr:unnamed protein product [Vitrella brassicaformis CCMP3155]|eukprot:CEM13966.1 unnamed protein product [Vitrella brassicaformis CCMP3155]
MRVGVEGCCHGELNAIYRALEDVSQRDGVPVDLLLMCGDFQSARFESDMQWQTMPPKYRKMMDFHEYYSGAKTAPCLTIFVGGNHEAPNVLSELYFGGWVAPNIFFLGSSGVVRVGDLRIGGYSGIYKPYDYNKGYFEKIPYDDSTRRTACHTREFEIKKLGEVREPVDVMLSHDWPNGVVDYGDRQGLIQKKPFFKDDLDRNQLGNTPAMLLLRQMKPRFWFSAHLHVKFASIIPHHQPPNGNNPNQRHQATRFLALDKVHERRPGAFLQILDIDMPSDTCPAGHWLIHNDGSDGSALVDAQGDSAAAAAAGADAAGAAQEASSAQQESSGPSEPLCIRYDAEWLSILRANHPNIPYGPHNRPHNTCAPTDDDRVHVQERLQQDAQDGRWPHWTSPDGDYRDLPGQRRAFLRLLSLEDTWDARDQHAPPPRPQAPPRQPPAPPLFARPPPPPPPPPAPRPAAGGADEEIDIDMDLGLDEEAEGAADGEALEHREKRAKTDADAGADGGD